MTEDRKPPEGQSEHTTYVPVPAYYLQGEQDDQVDLADYIRVLWRRRFLILLGTLVCALTAFVVTVMPPPIYQSKATLIAQPIVALPVENLNTMLESDFVSGSELLILLLKPRSLSVETLKTMLGSDYIANKLRNQLLEKNVIQPDTPMEQVKDMLSVEIPARGEPLIDLVVEADSPEKAEIFANTWAEIFLVENATLTKSLQQANLDLIESQYPVVKNTVMKLESQLKEKQDHYEQALLRLDKSWGSRIVDFRKETERSQKEHQKETERLRLEFTNRWKLDLLKGELEIKEAKLVESEGQESVREGINELQDLITQKEIELFVLLKDRELELSNLLVDGQAEVEILERTKKSEITLLENERDLQVSELNREIYAARRIYEPVAEKYMSVELANPQEEPDVRIASLAVAPERPMGRRTSLNTLIALTVGFMLSMMLAFVLEYAQSISLTESSGRDVEVSPSRSPGLELDSPSATRRKLANS